MSKEAKTRTCRRCGRCCMHMHSDDNGMPCECLLIEEGVATCLLHNETGIRAKPGYCVEYPEVNGEPCWFHKDYTPEGRRSEQKIEKSSEASR